MAAKRSIRQRLKDKAKGLYHDVRGSVSADYTPPSSPAPKPKAKPKAKAKAKPRTSVSLPGVLKTVRRRKREYDKGLDIKKYLR
jgi:hypothetical protein